MGSHTSHELEQRRDELVESLPALARKRTDAFRLNSDALALSRAGVKQQATQELGRLGEEEVAADAAIRVVQQELRQVEAEIQSTKSSGGLGAKFGRAVRRGRSN